MPSITIGRRRIRLLAASLLAMAIAVPTLGATTATAASSLPCDIYAAGGTPCETAHSTTRALFASYNGPLYQVKRASDSSYLNINTLAAGGVANAAAQDSFCAGTSCTITKIYDQTANHNDLPISWGGYWKGPGPNGSDIGANATALPLTIGGQKAYGVKVTQGVGYRVDNAKAVPTGSQPEGVYMITSSNDVDQWCCFDYGSGENSHTDTGNATMNAIEWGTACWFGGCSGSGPWVEADLENGMYSSNTGPNPSSYQGVHFSFVTAMEKNNGTSNFTLKYGNAASGGLTTGFSGPLPNGYSPMKTDSSILLGTGGDNSNSGVGEFFEGAVTAGYPSDATENAVQASVTAAGYGGSGGSTGGSTGALHAVGAGKCLDDPNSTTTLGTQQQIYTCNGAANQTWTHNSSNELTLSVGGSTLCLDANGKGTTAGTKVIVYSCNGQTNQQWNLNSNGTVTGVQSGLCLDVTGASTANGALVELWTCNGGSNQQWTLG
ncbi:ricin-type beta-trefoil lectin domain protein [Actinocrinis puniceicyclus]|uniref:Ricin-type beta-trefoil lectin domain protein n=1 Tax=Actinocrinis puniceicyclus TaxID=977794 RepID=A0A8J7WTP1_9ACTN|nr:arabinofuranosidase catalytic domain-containing protein [Actinocrinis puniceicyclus]MBS2966282.1 ricin-type beta-trefoil lectin domain protein [Actinocrinis puniceicyclus]